MALELQIQTSQAQASIQAATTAVREFITVTQQLSRSTAQIDSFANSLNSIRPVSSEVAASLRSAADAALSLGSATSGIQRFQTAMSGLGGSTANTAAAGIRNVSSAAASLQAPAGLDRLVTGMSAAGRAAQGLVNPMAAAMAAAARTGQSFDTVAQGMSAAGNASRTTSAALSPMIQGMSAAGTAAEATRGNLNNLRDGANGAGDGARNAGEGFRVFSGILQAMAFSVAISGLRDLVSGSLEASAAVTRLKVQVDNTTGTVGAGAAAFDHLAQRAFQLGIPIESMTKTFGRFVASMTAGGHSAAEAQQVYDNFMTTFRAFGLSADEVSRSFLAVDQVFQKGKVQSEELVKQLGQNIPAMTELARSMGLVDDAGKPMTATLQQMLKQGQVTSDVFIKFSQDLATKYGPAAQQMATTGAAAFDRLGTAFFLLKSRIGDNIFAAMTPAINSLATAMFGAAVPVSQLGRAFGTIAGAIGAGVVFTFQQIATGVGTLAFGFNAIIGVISGVYGYFSQLAQSGSFLGQALNVAAQALSFVAQTVGPLIGLAAAASVAVYAFGRAWSFVTGIVSGASAIFSLLSNPIVQLGIVAAAAVAGIIALGVAIVSLKQSISNGSSFADNFSKNLAALKDAASGAAGALLGSLVPGLDQAASSADSASQSTSGTSGSAQDLAQSSDSAASSTDSLSSSLGRSKSAADSAADSYSRAASAARDMNSATTSTGNSSYYNTNVAVRHGPGDTESYHAEIDYLRGLTDVVPTSNGKPYHSQINSRGSHYYRYGGISGQRGIGNTSFLPASAFANAPHFAAGGTTGPGVGGIPAVLHPNEAVVPLQGGAIPVAFSGGAPSSNSGAAANPVVSLLSQITEDDTTRDNLIGMTNDKLDLMLGQITTAFPKADSFYSNALNALNAIIAAVGGVVSAVGNISSSSGGGSYSGGGGVGGSLGGTSGGTAQDAYSALQSQLLQNNQGINTKFQDSIEQLRQQAGLMSLTTGQPLANFDYLQKQYDQSDTAKQNAAIIQKNQELVNAFIAQYGEKAYRDLQKQTTSPFGMTGVSSGGGGSPFFGFATGSPNASKDADGGFHATLHPDEAVIPLPDGRSVPVSMPADWTAFMRQFGGKLVGSSPAGSSGGSVIGGNTQNVNVSFVVQTPDASSFRKSQPQIIADLRGQLQRAAQTSGSIKRSTEDPTIRDKG